MHPGGCQWNIDQYTMWEVGHAFASNTRKRSLSVSIRVDPWFAQGSDKRRQAQL